MNAFLASGSVERLDVPTTTLGEVKSIFASARALT